MGRSRVAVLGLLLAWAPSALAEDASVGHNPRHQGHALYQQLCSECHGVRADGTGPRAEFLNPRPPDLTRLEDPAGGPVRVEALARVIDGRRTLRAHGEGEMPVWGWVLVADVPDPELREPARIRLVQTLAEYIVSIQSAKDGPGAPGGSGDAVGEPAEPDPPRR